MFHIYLLMEVVNCSKVTDGWTAFPAVSRASFQHEINLLLLKEYWGQANKSYFIQNPDHTSWQETLLQIAE